MTEAVASSVVTLPIYPHLTDEETDFIISSVEQTVKRIRKK